MLNKIVKFIISFLEYPGKTFREICGYPNKEDFDLMKKYFCKAFKRILFNPWIIFMPESYRKHILVFHPFLNLNKISLIRYNDIPKNIEFEKSMQPLVSIIVIANNSKQEVLTCLYSILKNTPDIDYEVILAVKETDYIVKRVKNIKIIEYSDVPDYKRIMKVASGKYISFLNDIKQVQPNWLDSMLSVFTTQDKVGIVSSKILYNDKVVKEAGILVYKDKIYNGNFVASCCASIDFLKEVDCASIGSMLILRELAENNLDSASNYNTAFFANMDLNFRVKADGYKIYYQPLSIAIAYDSPKESGVEKELYIKDEQYFDKKWAEYLTQKESFELSKPPFSNKMRKKTIVIIDDFLPQFDKHAGGKTIFHFIKLLVNMGLHVKFIPAYNFIKEKQYANMLQQLGVEVLAGNVFCSKEAIMCWFANNFHYVDYVLLSRPDIAIEYLDIVGKYPNIKKLYYGHDLHHLRLQREYQLKKSKKILNLYEDYKQVEYKILNNVDVAYYPSKVEVDYIKSVFPSLNIKVVPPYVYENPVISNKSYNETKDILFVGSFSHSPNVDGILWFVNEIFPKILKAIPDIKLNILGSNMLDKITKLESSSINIIGFVEQNVLSDYYKKSRIVVAPLRYGAGIKGKIIEAIYNNVPVVTTTVGAEGIDNINRVITIADEPEEFANKVIGLYNNKDEYDKIVKNSSKIIESQFSVQTARSVFEKEIDTSLRVNK